MFIEDVLLLVVGLSASCSVPHGRRFSSLRKELCGVVMLPCPALDQGDAVTVF